MGKGWVVKGEGGSVLTAGLQKQYRSIDQRNNKQGLEGGHTVDTDMEVYLTMTTMMTTKTITTITHGKMKR